MGLIIEKEKSKEGEGQEDDDKEERDDEDRDAKKDKRKKRRKKDKTRKTGKLDEGGTSFEIRGGDGDPREGKSQQRKLELLKGYWKTSPREGVSSQEECHPTDRRGVDTKTEGRTDRATDLNDEQKLEKAIHKDARETEKSKDCCRCELSCCLRVQEDMDDIQDEKSDKREGIKAARGKELEVIVENVVFDESHSSNNETYLSGRSAMETKTKSTEETSNLGRHPVIKGSRRGHDFPGGSPFSIRRYHDKKSRYQSSRPTSLETIIEDATPSPFFFQDSIIQYPDGREDHRGIRKSPNLFQVRQEEESDDRWGEDSSEEENEEVVVNTLPLRNSRIFRGVIENLNYIFDNNGDSNGTFTPDTTDFLFQDFREEYTLGKRGSISSSSSSKCDYETEERLRDISEKEEEEDEEEEEERHSGIGGALKRSFPQSEHSQSLEEAFIQNHPFQKQFQLIKDVEHSVSLPEISRRHKDSSSSSSEETKGNLSFTKLGCERPQVVMAGERGEAWEQEESLRRFYFLKDMSGGSDIEWSCCENLSTPKMTPRIESLDSSTCNIDEGDLADRPFNPQEVIDVASGAWDESMGRHGDGSHEMQSQTKVDSCTGFEKSSEKELDENVVLETKGGIEERISSFEVQRTVETQDTRDKEENKSVMNIGFGSKSIISSLSDLRNKFPSRQTPNLATDSLRKVSFTVYIQYEAISTEIIPKELSTQGETGKIPHAKEENQLAIARPLHETTEGEGSLLMQDGDFRMNYQLKLLKAIQSLDSLNDQIVEFIFSGAEFEEEHGGSPKQREALKSSMSLMRRLLVDAQSKFRKMVEDNKQLASRIDGELQTAHQEVNILRQELADTNRRITQIQEHNNHHNMDDIQTQQEGGMSEGVPPRPDTPTTTINGPNKYHSESSSNQLAEEMSQLRLENEKLSARNRSLQREVEELRRVKESMVEEDLQLKPQINQMTMELTHAKEALSALKADRKRLKAEKFDLLNQMKQLYATLEDKEKELRDFIRNYEQRMKESDESLRHLAAERDETEREKWNILKHARDESEKVVKLSAQLGLKEAEIKKLQDDLDMVRKQLTSVGYYSDAESVRTNGLPTPTASTPTCSPQPVSTPTPTPNGRGSSADSGVRLSSDRDSTASHDGGMGTPKESPSLSPLYATPSCIRDDRGGDSTPTGGPMPSGHSLNSSAMSGLASSNASTGGLSRSAEQLCERLAETSDTSKGRGSNTLSRKSNKSGGTWGSISRVFARQKKRAALDASLYDGNGSDKRASWSPSSSLCVSPLTEESYSEKLRLLEEAQHIPLERWKAPTVLAWLEVTLGMPQYGAMCAENVRSGKVLLELNDSELEAGLGISHPMHRKKLRLAIEELREPRLSRYPRISALGHTWVSSEWLPDLGLPQYCDAFANNLVDGRLLEALTKKELEKHLGVHRKFHQASIIHGVHLLRIVRFDRQILAERRRQSEHVDCDPIVWTNIRWVKWARTIDLAEYADNLKDSGVHGALVVLESSFTSDTMATALGIPQSKNIIRRHLATELESLVNPARQQLDEQARYAKLERRRQEKLAAGGSLGRSFSRSYGTGLERAEKDKRRASLRGSLSRALGLRVREEINAAGNGGESSSSGGQSPAVSSRAHPHHPPQARPRSSVMPSGVYVHHETHRRVKSIGDIETITVTPV